MTAALAAALFAAVAVAMGLGGRALLAQSAPFDLAATLRDAEEGAVIQVPAGTYQGPFTIDKPLTLEGIDRPVLLGDGDGDVVHIVAPDVTLRGFALRGTGVSLDREDSAVRVTKAPRATIEDNQISDALFGIYFEEAPGGVIRGNTILGKELPESRRGDAIKLFYSADSLIEANELRLTRDSLVWFSPGTTVRNNIMTDGRYGLHFMSTDNHVIEGNILQGNSVAIYLMYGSNYTLRDNVLAGSRGPSGYGLGLKETNDAIIEGNRIVGNRVGVYNDASPLRPEARIVYRNNVFGYNEIGMLFLPNVMRNQLSENIFLDNSEQVNISGGGQLMGNEWAIDGLGNYWSDYNGFDADGDHVGELPYESHSLYESLTAKYPGLRLFQLSPAADAIDLAAKAFPIFQPRPILADPYPLTQPPTLAPAKGFTPPSTTTQALTALGLLAVALLVLALGLRGFAPRPQRAARHSSGATLS